MYLELKKDAIGRQIRVNDEPPQRPPIQTSLTAVGGPRFPMWYRIKKHGTTSQSGKSRGNTQTTRLWPAGVSTYAAAQSQGNERPQGDGQRTPKNPRDRLTDVFGEPLFGIESGEHLVNEEFLAFVSLIHHRQQYCSRFVYFRRSTKPRFISTNWGIKSQTDNPNYCNRIIWP